jgi:predicted DCC family thiol-disulfide oxidoreductase YuxK
MNIILFDGLCNLCNNLVSFLIKYDKNNIYHFAALQTNVGEKIIHKYHILNDRKSIILIKEGIVLYKSDAIIEIAKKLSGWPYLLKYAFLFPKFLRDGIYDLIAKNRYYIFGKKEICPIPSENDKKKFIF